MAVNTQKLLPGSTFSTVKTDTENIKKQVDPKLNIYKKVIKIDKLLKNSFLIQSKEQTKQRKDLENQKKEKREKDLEAPKKFKGFQILKNALPRTGFLDSIKRFILFTFAGWLFTNLFQFLPKLLEFVKIISPVISWFEKGIGTLLEGVVSFIDLGYKAYDSVKSFAKTIGGEKFAQKFDALSGALNTFLNLAFIAAMSAGSFGGLGKGKKPGIGGGKPTAPAGKPRVTTSGGGTAGRPDLRNPLRQRPKVTTSRGGAKSPLRQGPKVTTSGGKVAGKGLGKFAGKLPFVGPLIDFGIRRLIFKEPLGKAAAGAVGAGAGQALGGVLGGSLGGIVGSVVPIAGTLLGAGAGSLIGSIIGGFIGDWIGVSLYDFIESQKDIKTKKMSSGGKVSSSSVKNKKQSKLKRKQEIPQKIQPGKDIGGEKEIEKLYPNPDRKFFGIFSGFSWNNLLFGGKDKDKDKKKDTKKIPNAIKTLLNVADSLGTSGDWIGSLMRAGIQVALGQMPNAKSLAKTISGVLRNVTDPAIKGIKSLTKELFGFADGGQVSSLSSSLLSSGDTLTLERSIETNLRNKFEDSLGVVRKESKKRGVGRDEMIEKNIRKGKEGGEGGEGEGPGGVTVSGGNEDFWSLVAIASREDSDPQAWADIAQSIYNRAATGMYGGGKNIKAIINSSGQYEPTFSNPKDWKAITDIATASKASGKSQAYLQKVAAAILDQKLQKNAADFVGGRSDFMGESQKGSMRPDKGDVTRGRGDNYFGWFYNAKLKEAAKPPGFGKISKKESDTKSKSKDTYDSKVSDVGLGKGYGSAGSKIAGELGRYIKKALKQGPDFQAVTEHPEHGGVVGTHSRGSYHYSGRAIDIGAWDYEQPKILRAIEEFNKKRGVKPVQLLHAKNEPDGHSDHVHVAYQGGGLVSPSKPNVNVPNSFASYNDPRKSSTLAVQPVIVEKMMPFPVDSPIAFPSGGSSGVNNSVLPSLMQG